MSMILHFLTNSPVLQLQAPRLEMPMVEMHHAEVGACDHLWRRGQLKPRGLEELLFGNLVVGPVA